MLELRIGVWRSWLSAPALGAGGPPFESEYPDYDTRSFSYYVFLTHCRFSVMGLFLFSKVRFHPSFEIISLSSSWVWHPTSSLILRLVLPTESLFIFRTFPISELFIPR